ncbi:hypothetical protein COT97_00370 [Candidatus Falkowbacteria bacterium CG10_big_fil_rev_8_21_14_0_10_39_11]|uniref:SbsA Ig-like domain-containing protein n=1 Tax=Candidatus Falkowbacteria bacterium CG10_big_fil_rev_8_21_14_0_10_39_11 TaxID=1974565 RepID=A0A2H0V6A3_9BACT|nr:MAG: hypothetical protein COT97_00370 [Candidatus Falkowbacteria bacterium CG10_big_fil_rev_8_21_14_0_10_39_11]
MVKQSKNQFRIFTTVLMLATLIWTAGVGGYLLLNPYNVSAGDSPIVFSEVEVSPGISGTNLFTSDSSFESWADSTIPEPFVDMNGNSIRDEDEPYCDLDSGGTHTTYSQALPNSADILGFSFACGGSVTQETTDVYDGSSAIRINTGDGEMWTVYPNETTSISNLTQYTVSFYAKGLVGGEKIYLMFEPTGLDASEYSWNFVTESSAVYEGFITEETSKVYVLTDSWARYTYTFTSDLDGTASIGFVAGGTGDEPAVFMGSGANQVMLIDAVQFEADSTASSYNTGGSAGSNFVELYNRGGGDIDVDGYTVEYKFGAGDWATFGAVSGSNTYSGGYFFNFKASGGDAGITDESTFDSAFLTNSNSIDGLSLRLCSNGADCANTILDTVGFGSTATAYEGVTKDVTGWSQSKSFERKALFDSTAATMASGGSDEPAGNSFDSDNNNWDFVLRTTPEPQVKSSTREVFADNVVFEDVNPYIYHEPVVQADDNGDLYLFAGIFDDSDIATTGVKIYYRVGDSGSFTAANSTKTVTATPDITSSDYYAFIIPQADLQAAVADEGEIQYYLEANDGVYTTTMPDYNPTSYPLSINVTGTYTGANGFSGTVTDTASAAINGALVFINGTGFFTSTDASGNYSFASLPSSYQASGSYRVTAVISNRMDSEYIAYDGDTTVNITLPTDFGNFSGGDKEAPFVSYTSPFDGMYGMPINICDPNDSLPPGVEFCSPIMVGFSESMNSSTVNNTNVTVYNWATSSNLDNLTIEANGSDSEFIIYSTTPLAPNTTYTVSLGTGVKDHASNALGGNMSDGTHEFTFTTEGTEFTGEGDQEFGSGAFQPPFVRTVSPNLGGSNIALNAKLVVDFVTSVDVSETNLARIKLYDGDDEISVTHTYSTDNQRVFLQPSTTLTANTEYEIQVAGSFTSSMGVSLGDPGQSQNSDNYVFFASEFKTGATSDTVGPKVMGHIPASGETSVAVGLSAVEIAVNESLDSSTVNTTNVKLKRGSTVVGAEVVYKETAKAIRILPSSALQANTSYTVTVGVGVTDIVGNAFNQDEDASNGEALEDVYVFQFTTMSTIESTAPTVMDARCDDYQCVITYSESMNHVKQINTEDWTDAVGKWETSVLNKTNYNISVDTGGGLASADLSSVLLSYDGYTNTVSIKNLNLLSGVANPVGQQMPYTVTVYSSVEAGKDGVRDVVGNALAANAVYGGSVELSSATGGFFGPDADGFGSDGPGDFGMHDAATMGEKPIGVWPMNGLVGSTTHYFVDLPVTSVVPNGGIITMLFPSGFNVANAAIDSNSPMNKDVSAGSGNVTLNCSGDAATRLITCTVTGATNTNDYLSFELKGIVNSNIPKDFNTSGYTVEVKTKNGSTLLESFTTMPFFITAGGNNSITLNVYAGAKVDATTGSVDVDGTTMNLFVGSPMTGPLDQTVTFTNGYATATINNLPSGEYFAFTEPSVTLGASDYSGIMPEPIHLNSSVSKDLILSRMDESSAAALTVLLTGDFGADEDVDIFAGHPKGFVVKTIENVGSVVNQPYTVYLPYNGDWFVGMGPSMSKGAVATTIAMPDWMPPKDKMLKVTGVGESVQIKNIETQGDVTSSGVSFAISQANYQINGTVVDGSNNVIANAEVWAYQPMGFGGSGNFTRTGSDGTFTLKIAEYGVYKVGAFLPGMPESPELSINVKANSAEVDGNATSDIYRGGTLVTAGNPFKLKLLKADYTISGKVKDANANAIQYAPVWAEETTTKQLVHAGTDSGGSYVLYVGAGTWLVKSEAPFGSDACGGISKTVTVVDGSKTGQNLEPTAGTCYTLSGTISIGGTLQTNAPVFVDGWTGDLNTGYPNGIFKDAKTNSAGQFSVKVGNGTYRVGTWTSDFGERAILVSISGADSSGNDITVTSDNLKTLTIDFTGGLSSMTGFLEAKKINTSDRRGKPVSNLAASETMQLESGMYKVFLHVDGVGDFNNASVDLSSDASVVFDISSVSLNTLTGTVEDTDGTAVPNAWVWVHDPNTDYHNGVATGSDGTYSMSVKSGTGFKIGVDKPNYVSPAPHNINISGTASYDFTNNMGLSATQYIISGTATGTNLADGFIWAESATEGWSGSPIDIDGTFSLPVSDGTWTLKGVAALHAETTYGSPIVIDGASQTGISFALTSDVTKSVKSAVNSITPSVGGVIQDNDVGAKVVVPPNALGSGSSAGNMTMAKSYTAPSTNAYAPLEGQSINISVTDNNGQPITNLNDQVELTLDYSVDNLPAGVVEDDLVPAYWDGTTNQWIPITGVQDSDDNSFTAQTDHFTIFGVVYSPLVSSSSAATNSSRSSQLAEEGRVESDVTGTTDSIEIIDEATDSADEETVNEATDEITDSVDELETVTEVVEEVVEDTTRYVPILPTTRDLDGEKDAISKYVGLENRLPAGDDWKVVQFITYGGASETQNLTDRERVGLLVDFKDMYGRVPSSDIDWKDLNLIAQGEQPTRIIPREADAIRDFMDVYGRLVNFKSQVEEKFVHMVAYRYRVESRDLNKENTALGIFSNAYGYLPNSAHLWSVLRAIAYSGVK